MTDASSYATRAAADIERSIMRIHDDVVDHVSGIRSAEDGLALVQELVVRLARNSAERVFMVGLDLAPHVVAGIADRVAHGHCAAILDTMLQFGGTAEITGDLVEASVWAFGERLDELAGAVEFGGVA